MTERTSFRALLILAAVLASALLVVSNASAAWQVGGQLASGSLTAASPSQSSSISTDPVISRDGHYEFFVSRSSALSPSAPYGGVFRKNLWNDAAPLDVVDAQAAGVSNANCGIPLAQGSFISASANGRYVAFSTSENNLVPGDTNGRRDVYVRDMNATIGSAGAFELASAPDGASGASLYQLADLGGGDQIPVPASDDCMYGAELPGPNSLSNDGSKVIFSNTAFTSISATHGITTAPGNLWVRTTGSSHKTELITKVAVDYDWKGVTPNPQVTVGGPLPDQEFFDNDPDSSVRFKTLAAISGDGSAVVWGGPFARYQTDYNTGENASYSPGNFQTVDYLYRRIADGAAAKTRRANNWADVDDVNCDPNLVFNYNTDPDPGSPNTYYKRSACAGPFANDQINPSSLRVPAITDDGRRVFMLTTQPGHNLSEYLSGEPLDLVTTDMSPGVSRKNGTKWITRTGTVALLPDVIDQFAVSGDGKRAAIYTTRRDFTSTGLVQQGTFPATKTTRALFVIDGSQGSVDGENAWSGAPIEWVAKPTAGTTDASQNFAQEVFSLDASGHRLAFAAKDPAFFAGANGEYQAYCVSDTGSGCQTAPAAAAPTVTIGAPASGANYAAAVAASYSVLGATSVSCTWDAEPAQSPCPSSPLAPKSLSAGSHTFSVTGSNGTGSTTVTSTFNVGSPPPAATISFPAEGASITSPVTPTYSVSGSPDRVRCWFDLSQWIVTNAQTDFNCPATLTNTTLAAGPHTFNVTTANAFGSTTVTRSFTVSGPAPVVTISNITDGGLYANTISAQFTATNSPTSVQCKVDAGAYSNCTSPKSLGALSSGTGSLHSFYVKATNASGTTTVFKSFTVVGTAPTVAINSPANGATGVGSPVTPMFTIGGGRYSGISCQWDAEPVINGCTQTGIANKQLSNGSHTLAVTVSSPAGNASATSTFSVIAPPTVAISAPTEGQTLPSPVTAGFTVTGSPTSVKCQWDSEAEINGCTSPQGPKSLVEGAHTFKVTATNGAGSTTLTRNFTVAQPPTVAITSPADGAINVTSPVSPAFTLGGGAATSVKCQWDAEAEIDPCTQAGIAGKALPHGVHTLKVTASNGAGTDSDTSSFTVLDAPTVTIDAPTEGQQLVSPVSTAAFTLGGGAATSVKCQWDSESEISSCTSPLGAKTLSAGAHKLKVTATGPGGSASATRNFTILAAPTVTISSPANGATGVSSPLSPAFTLGGGAAASVTCQWDAEAVISGCTQAGIAGKSLADGSHSLTVTATNAAGNGQAITAFTVSTATPPPPPPPPAGGGSSTPSVTPGSPKVSASGAAIPLSVTGSGNVSAKGTAKLPKGKKTKNQVAGTGSVTVSGDGSVTLNFKLNAAAKKYLKAKKKLTVAVTITYTPAGGSPITKTLKLSFKAKK